MRKKKQKEQKKAQASVADYACLIEPLVTEKTSLLSGAGGGSTAAFKVNKSADKQQIKDAVEKVFGVEVAKVRVCNYIGKLKRTTRAVGRTASKKKAYITLKPGHTIDVVEGV